MDKILIQGIRFHGYHGVTQSEQQLGQKYEIDLKIGTTNDQFSIVLAGQSDDLEQTLDYAIIVDSVIKIGTQQSFQLFESLAEAVAQEILNRFGVTDVWVRVKKLSPPIQPSIDFAGVEIHRTAS
ncbi:MAG: dihydroneopterin aldolase [Candidatus Poribacteria bacterium]|jgi:dihydroneopterin aldolase|nr:dihydroneopterin aldolase [Candidatus Poribacteria bacterium]MDP6751295.1 dihydroneopterin aldolase [Candidatus Poribacteria bacterium]MDP6961580.1 dihydroneopterin aldolase [Dehalococcoidia bacterium]